MNIEINETYRKAVNLVFKTAQEFAKEDSD